MILDETHVNSFFTDQQVHRCMPLILPPGRYERYLFIQRNMAPVVIQLSINIR